MTVKQLIEELKGLPQSDNVGMLSDGSVRSMVNVVFMARSGKVVLADFDNAVYYTEDRPIYAPTDDELAVWKTPNEPIKECL
jgi:hypothetical protein